jgi:hypothetical protein
MRTLAWSGTILALLWAIPAAAYIGPGAGVTVLGSFFSTLIVIVLAIVSILFWPVRYLWRRLRAKFSGSSRDSAPEHREVDGG